MLIAYILSKRRFQHWKIITSRNKEVFEKNGYEYKLDRDAQYQKKFLGIFFTYLFSQYLEGIPNPLIFSDKGYTFAKSDASVSEISYLANKIIKGVMDIIIYILVIINIVMTFLVLRGVNLSG